jgi:hypothetical protein
MSTVIRYSESATARIKMTPRPNRHVITIHLCLTICLLTQILGAQVISQSKGKSVNPYKELDGAAHLANSRSDDASVRGLADAVFSFPRALPRAPEVIENVVKDRLVRAETAYRNGLQQGVRERDIVELFNSVSDKLGLPSYAKTSPQQVRTLRMQLALSSPAFMASGLANPNMKVGESVPDSMSPLQAIHLINSLLDQKVINPEYQVEPAEWDRLHLPAAMAKIQQMQRLQASAQAGDKPAKPEVTVFHKSRDLHNSLIEAGSTLSFSDAMDLVDQAFTTLKIGH